MYKLLLADDEGIVLDSLEIIIRKNFGKTCKIETAKTGREVIKTAETFFPDIIIMDIQMPGINGIDAIEEIKKFNHTAQFIIMSAFDKFDYAKRAIDLGVIEFITKPANSSKIVKVLEKAMDIIDTRIQKREDELKNKEKLETVIPMIESGMIYTILFQDDYAQETKNYKQLLDIGEDFGYIFVIEFGEERTNDVLANPVGMAIKAQKFYTGLRERIKEFFYCVIGPVMANRVVVFVPCPEYKENYNERVQIIERARNLNRKLSNKIDAAFKIGIGSVQKAEEIYTSYKEANQALKYNKRGSVAHIDDFMNHQELDKNYPIENERNIIHFLKKGNISGVLKEGALFFDWTVLAYGKYVMEIKLKILEIVMFAERQVFENGCKSYSFSERTGYLTDVLAVDSYEELKVWFLERLKNACEFMLIHSEKQYSKAVDQAKCYIDIHYNKDISLDDVSQNVDISPYYFSRVFKEETGMKFIEYLTKVRIEKAKELLNEEQYSIKEVCIEAGYSDPNYFSRIFKKWVGTTPTEYRERYR